MSSVPEIALELVAIVYILGLGDDRRFPEHQ
jgi:hypothetical protein